MVSKPASVSIAAVMSAYSTGINMPPLIKGAHELRAASEMLDYPTILAAGGAGIRQPPISRRQSELLFAGEVIRHMDQIRERALQQGTGVSIGIAGIASAPKLCQSAPARLFPPR